jgi:hypothetical protein
MADMAKAAITLMISSPRLHSCHRDLSRGMKLINAEAGEFALDGALEISNR